MAYDRDNVFARIVRGELPCTKVHEDEHVLAFRDIAPQAPSHVVLIPKGGYVSADDFAEKASDAELAAFVRAVGKIVVAEGLGEGGFRLIANTGEHGHQEVPHFHMHIVGGRDLGPMLRRSS
jgi:histidine triad (HIT) family protein